ncbi:hypothetical protein ACJJTC_007178 [Scirpophaga incertulas]
MELENLLASWDVPQDIIKNFTDNGITIETLKDLSPLYLKELCPHIGYRIKLTDQIQNFLDSLADTKSMASSDLSELSQAVHQKDILKLLDSNESTHREPQNNSLEEILDTSSFLNEQYQRPPLPEFDIRTLLQTSAHGCSVLNYYQQFKHLNSKKRNFLVDILVKHIYTYIVNK